MSAGRAPDLTRPAGSRDRRRIHRSPAPSVAEAKAPSDVAKSISRSQIVVQSRGMDAGAHSRRPGELQECPHVHALGTYRAQWPQTLQE